MENSQDIWRGKRWTNGRGYKKFCYTLLDIARIKGVEVASVRQAVYRGKLIPDDLLSVARYLLEGRKMAK